MLMTLFAANLLAQEEVRGIETRLTTYQGDKYKASLRGSVNKIVAGYYGFELTNRNSITVSVSVEVYTRENNAEVLVATKDIVLNSGETYIMKKPQLKKYIDYSNPGYDPKEEELLENGKENADRYYVKYKAFKLL